MKYYGLILFIITSITNPSHCMEIIKKNKHRKLHSTKNYWVNPIIVQSMLTQRICDPYKLPTEIVKHITSYNIALKNNTFENNTNPFATKWNDFRIPTSYIFILTSEQMSLIQELLTSTPHRTTCVHGQCTLEYALKSKKDYALFLTIPLELRKCLTLLPKSEVKKYTNTYLPLKLKKCLALAAQPETEDYSDILPCHINAGKTILVKNMSLSTKIKNITNNNSTTPNNHRSRYEQKLITPEETD